MTASVGEPANASHTYWYGCQRGAAAVGYGSFIVTEPVSSSDLRLERTLGQPPDRAVMSFEGSRSTVCVIESFTAVPKGSTSIVQYESPSAARSGLSRCRHRMTRRRGGSASTISPESQIRPSG